jgi:hypothetical protein
VAELTGGTSDTPVDLNRSVPCGRNNPNLKIPFCRRVARSRSVSKPVSFGTKLQGLKIKASEVPSPCPEFSPKVYQSAIGSRPALVSKPCPKNRARFLPRTFGESTWLARPAGNWPLPFTRTTNVFFVLTLSMNARFAIKVAAADFLQFYRVWYRVFTASPPMRLSRPGCPQTDDFGSLLSPC